MNDITIKPITIFKSVWYFLISSLLIYLGLYIFIPIFLNKGVPFLAGYLVLFYCPFVLLFLQLSFYIRKKEMLGVFWISNRECN